MKDKYDLGPDDIDDSEMPEEFEWIVYYYTAGNYDGDGIAVWKLGDKYGWQDMGHCSCYGPTNHISDREFNSLDDLYEVCSNELQGQLSDVIEAAYKWEKKEITNKETKK